MAKCPMCKNVELQVVHHADQPPVSECRSCSGTWLRANEYMRWLKTQMPGTYNLAKSQEASTRFPVIDSNQASVCPDCGHFLRKYQVSSKLDFHLDRCNNCNGVWLDHNEWQTLKEVDLHDEIHRIFTQPWQKQIQDEITAQKMDDIYREQFGESDYEKIKALRMWLHTHPNRNRLIAFLLDRDPYDI